MLDAWLSAAHRDDTSAKEKRAFVEDLKKLPTAELKKLASGEITLSKLAHGLKGPEWLSKFDGTPLFDQALQLEQQDLELDVARKQENLQRHSYEADYKTEEQIDLQKRLLELQLVQSMTSEQPPVKAAHDSHAEEASWVDTFRGTPLFDNAVALEQQRLGNEQARVQRQLEEPPDSKSWMKEELVHIQKKQLELALAKMQEQSASPEAPAQGAGAPGMGAANNEEAMSPGPFDGTKLSGYGGYLQSKEGSMSTEFFKAATAYRKEKRAYGYAPSFGTSTVRGKPLPAIAREKAYVPVSRPSVPSPTGGGAVAPPPDWLYQNVRNEINPMTEHIRTQRPMTAADTADIDRSVKAMQRGTLRGALSKAQEAGGAMKQRFTEMMSKAKDQGMTLADKARSLAKSPSIFSKLRTVKVGSVMDPEMADRLGRELARADFAKLAEEHKNAAKAPIRNFGGAVSSGYKALGKGLKDINKATGGSLGTGALAGGAAGAIGGAISGARPDEQGETHVLRNALGGAAGGALLGGGLGAATSGAKNLGKKVTALPGKVGDAVSTGFRTKAAT